MVAEIYIALGSTKIHIHPTNSNSTPIFRVLHLHQNLCQKPCATDQRTLPQATIGVVIIVFC